MSYLQSRAAAGELVTGLIYMDNDACDMHANLNTVATPLNRLSEAELCPGSRGWRPSTPRIVDGFCLTPEAGVG